MLNGGRRFCTESTFHGFYELFYANSLSFKLFWFLIIVAGCFMTCFQVYRVTDDYYQHSTGTEISILPKEISVQYPAYSLYYYAWFDWLNLSKVEELNFDIDTLFYAMSYFNSIWTSKNFNVSLVKNNLSKIMARNNFSDLFDLGNAISMKKPRNIKSVEPLTRFLNRRATVNYYGQLNQVYNGSENVNHVMKFSTFRNFESTTFWKEFYSLYKYNLTNDYKNLRLYWLGQFAFDDINDKSAAAIQMNMDPAGQSTTFEWLDLLSYNYHFYIKPVLYKWIPTVNRTCSLNKAPKSYTDCYKECNVKYRTFKVTGCTIYFVQPNYTMNWYERLHNYCIFDSTMANNSNITYFDQLYNECYFDCMSSCNKWTYVYSQVLIPKPTAKVFEGEIEATVTLSFEGRENVLVVSLVPSVTWYGAVANVGGLLGLYLGGSIISVIQMIYLLLCVPLESRISNLWLNRNGNPKETNVFVQTGTNEFENIKKLKKKLNELKGRIMRIGNYQMETSL